ncbi:hypothetical protein [Dyadobacter frigoris]|uniref:hypothetical protein n=1 Tax=Dyadobacter frigoris TaxID=2576211 RepID=UPI002552B57F|nr:hypothetical protein [Dyadobacter frigoris]
MKIGFITEGHTEKIILKSDGFQEYLEAHDLEFVHEVIVAGGKDNLTRDKVESNVKILRDKGAEIILVLRDLDDCLNIEEANSKIMSDIDIVKVIAIQAIESWFLADTVTLGKILESQDFYFEKPEEEMSPFEKLRALRFQYKNKGIGDKKLFAKMMVNNGFTVKNASEHPDCPSAKYFTNKLESLTVIN